MGEYLKLHMVKMKSIRGKIDAIWWNIKIILQKLVDKMWTWIANELKTKQKDLTEVTIFEEVVGGWLLFWNNLYDC